MDRDGTINREVHYLKSIDDLELLPHSARAIKMLNDMGFLVIVVSNQSGIARGYFDQQDLNTIHNEIRKRLEEEGARIDDFFVCPHHPDDNCDCRKPKTGLIEKATKKYIIDLKQSFVIGDKMVDVKLGRNIGCQSILVRTGYGREYEDFINIKNDLIADDLLDSLKFISGNNHGI